LKSCTSCCSSPSSRWRSGAFAFKEKSIDDKINVGKAIANIERLLSDVHLGRFTGRAGKVWKRFELLLKKLHKRDSTGAIKSYRREMFLRFINMNQAPSANREMICDKKCVRCSARM
jgi:hypothetical protein